MCYTVSCVYYSRTKCFKNCKNNSTDGKVMAKIKVACFFLGHGVDMATRERQSHRFQRPQSGLMTPRQETPSNIYKWFYPTVQLFNCLV